MRRHLWIAGLGLWLVVLAACEGCQNCEGERAERAAIAECIEAKGDVRSHPPNELVWNAVAVGQKFGAGEWIRTGVKANATVSFLKGGAPLEVGANSTVILEAPEQDDQQEYRVEVKQGTVRGKIKQSTTPTNIVVKTASGESVRLTPGSEETEYRISVRKDARTEVAVLRGTATLATPDGVTRDLESGQAQDIADGAAVGETIALPDFPGLSRPPVDAKLLLRTGARVPLTWEPVAKAEAYIIEVARDGAWHRPEIATATKNRRWIFEPQESGIYFWRVATQAGSRQGEYGFARRIFIDLRPALDLLESPADQAVLVTERRARVQLVWRPHAVDTLYRVRVFAAKGNGKTAFETKTDDTKATVKRLRPGRYRWGVFIEDSDGRMWPAFEKLRTFKVERSQVRLRVPDKITF